MAWIVKLDPDFETWLSEQEEYVIDDILAGAAILKAFGPSLGRPNVDTLKGSKIKNLKELRVQCRGDPWRILFAFDPKREAILLVGGNKQGNKLWYKTAIPLAEKRYERHLIEIGEA